MNIFDRVSQLFKLFIDWISDGYNCAKPLIVAAFTWIMSVLSPVWGALVFMFIVFLLNIFIGVATAVNAKGEHFSIKKFFAAFKEIILYGVVAIFLYWFGDNFKQKAIMDTGVTWLTYIVVWGYLTNIFKNSHTLFPKSKPIEIIYLLLSTEVLNRLKSYIGLKSKQ